MSRRRWPTGFGGPTRPLVPAAVAIAALLVVGACTSTGAGEPTTTSTVTAVTSTTTVSTSTSTAAPTSTTSTTTSTVATTTVPPTDDVVEAWSAYWEAWVKVRASEDFDPAPLEAAAVAEVVDGAVTLFERQRSSGSGPVETEVALSASVVDVSSGRASIEDCVLLSPSFTDTVGVWYEADLTRTEEGVWVVDEVRIPGGGGCVPERMADEAIAGYEAFYAGWAEFWDPADPDSPRIGEVLAEPQKTLITDLLTDHQSRGAALRGHPTLHPEVIEVRSSTELVILNCLEPDTGYGLYDVASGERLDDVAAVRAGQRNLESAVMVLEGDLWKVSDLQGQVDFACEFAPTERGLPSV